MAQVMSSQLDKVREAAIELRAAQERRDQAIRLAAKTATMRQVAEAAEISHQRIAQIVHGS